MSSTVHDFRLSIGAPPIIHATGSKEKRGCRPKPQQKGGSSRKQLRFWRIYNCREIMLFPLRGAVCQHRRQGHDSGLPRRRRRGRRRQGGRSLRTYRMRIPADALFSAGHRLRWHRRDICGCGHRGSGRSEENRRQDRTGAPSGRSCSARRMSGSAACSPHSGCSW